VLCSERKEAAESKTGCRKVKGCCGRALCSLLLLALGIHTETVKIKVLAEAPLSARKMYFSHIHTHSPHYRE
jgi:hypothetical protein